MNRPTDPAALQSLTPANREKKGSGVFFFEIRHRKKTPDPFSGLRVKTSLSIFAMVVFGPLGNVLLGKGMKHVGAGASWAPADLVRVGVEVFTSGFIWLGIACLIAFFAAQLLVLSWADYSYVQPASSLAYGIVALLAVFALGEVVSPVRWVGVGVICAGVFIVGRTSPNTTDRQRS